MCGCPLGVPSKLRRVPKGVSQIGNLYRLAAFGCPSRQGLLYCEKDSAFLGDPKNGLDLVWPLFRGTRRFVCFDFPFGCPFDFEPMFEQIYTTCGLNPELLVFV